MNIMLNQHNCYTCTKGYSGCVCSKCPRDDDEFTYIIWTHLFGCPQWDSREARKKEYERENKNRAEYFITNGRWKIDEYLKYYAFSPIEWDIEEMYNYTIDYDRLEPAHYYKEE